MTKLCTPDMIYMELADKDNCGIRYTMWVDSFDV